MDLDKKIDRQYQKYLALAEAQITQDDQKKVDKAFNKLAKMFASEDDFKAYWKSKISGTIYL